jgi:hypothetical protein
MDWCCGWTVPKLRRERELVTDLEEKLSDFIAEQLAPCFGTTPDFVRAALPPSSEILSEAVDRRRGEVERWLEAKRRYENETQAMFRRVLGLKSLGPDIAAILRDTEAALEADPEYLKRQARVRSLPPSGRFTSGFPTRNAQPATTDLGGAPE